MTSKMLRFIGKGQITLPQEWRALLDFGESGVKATLRGNTIVLEPFPLEEKKEWNVESIELNDLSVHEKKLIRDGRTAYRKGKTDKFLSSSEFFKNTL